MGHQFEQHRDAEVPASPDQAWDAIATGPGITSWFMGRNEVDSGAVRTAFGDYAPELAITAAECPGRFAYASQPAEDGRFIAYEFITAVLVMVLMLLVQGFRRPSLFELPVLLALLLFGSGLVFVRVVERWL